MSRVRVFRSALLVGPFAALCAAGCVASPEEAEPEIEQAVEQALLSASPGEDAESKADVVILPGPDEGGVGIEATAPACIRRLLVGTRTLNLTNTCGRTEWVKVIIDLGADSSCFPMASGQIVNVTWVWPGTFGGLESC